MNTIKVNNVNTKMIAHRGLSGLERENTCAAFVAAGNRSYFGIETDIHKTADGQYVVFHDERTKRVTASEYDINVEENPYSALGDIVLPDIDSKKRCDLRIPLLHEYISICKKYEKKAVLELKNPFAREDIIEIVEIIKSLEYLDELIFISFSFENCRILKELLPHQDVQFLLEKEITDDIIDTIDKYRMNLDSDYKFLTKEIIDKVHSKGLTVNCWTVNDKESAEKLIEYGVDFITTNILE